jgi:hypothetical protein
MINRLMRLLFLLAAFIFVGMPQIAYSSWDGQSTMRIRPLFLILDYFGYDLKPVKQKKRHK